MSNNRDDGVPSKTPSSVEEVIYEFASINASSDPQLNSIPPQAARYMGKSFSRDFHGIRVRGTVTGYDAECEYFKIEYDRKNWWEELEEDELLGYLSPWVRASITNEASGHNSGGSSSNSGGESQKKKRAASEGDGTSAAAPKNKRTKVSSKDYVPLVYSEKKKDEYVWYGF